MILHISSYNVTRLAEYGENIVYSDLGEGVGNCRFDILKAISVNKLNNK